MKSIVLAFMAVFMLSACSGDDLKKQLAAKNQLLAAQEAEIKKIKDDMAARELDLKNQCEQRMQKTAAQHKQQVDGLNARIAELQKKRDTDKAQKAEPQKAKAKGSR